MENSKAVDTPIQKLNKKEEQEKIVKSTAYPYRETVGSLLYLSSKTRPDLAFAVGFASRHVENPSREEITNAKRILKYLNGTTNLGIEYMHKYDEDIIEAYTDSEYAENPDTRRSTTDTSSTMEEDLSAGVQGNRQW